MRHFEPAVSHLESRVIGCRVFDVPHGRLLTAVPPCALASRAHRWGERLSERWPPGCLCIVLEIAIFPTTGRAIDVLVFPDPARRSRPFCRLHEIRKVGATFKTYLGRSAFFATGAGACVLHTDRSLGAHGGNLSRRERRGLCSPCATSTPARENRRGQPAAMAILGPFVPGTGRNRGGKILS
jgi:hypothetical protein